MNSHLSGGGPTAGKEHPCLPRRTPPFRPTLSDVRPTQQHRFSPLIRLPSSPIRTTRSTNPPWLLHRRDGSGLSEHDAWRVLPTTP
jgi:hypothetical protein